MLVATLFYPFGYDQAVFSVGGEMVLKAAVPYRDFLDTKQPLIFYLYAFAMGLFGRHEWSIHLLDIFYQLFAAYYFFRILRRELSFEICTSLGIADAHSLCRFRLLDDVRGGKFCDSAITVARGYDHPHGNIEAVGQR